MTDRRADRTLAAAGLILIYAVSIGYTDNQVRVIALDAGLWQFHATRTAMALAMLAAFALVLGRRVRPRSWPPVALRSALTAAAMVIYFGALAFLPVALVAAGLFTAPIFVQLILRFGFGRPLGPVRVVSVSIGFLGVILMLGPEVRGAGMPGGGAAGGAPLAALLPVVAGALYAGANVVTGEYCRAETPETLLAGFFALLGVAGALGMAALMLWPVPVPEGPAAFLARGPVEPTGRFLFWTFVQAAGSLVAVGLAIRAYQMADAGRVAVFEYLILPASAVWGWVLWGERLAPQAWAGMALIAAAGALIALAGRSRDARRAPA